MLNLIILLWCFIGLGYCANYKVTAVRVNKERPLCSFKEGQSTYTCNYNPAFADLRIDNKPVAEGIFVRSQNITKPPYEVGQSVITLAESTSPSRTFDNLDDIKLTKIDQSSVVFEPKGREENYGVEDPRVVYREKDRTYYMYYTAVEQGKGEVFARLSLATTKTPKIKDSWERHGPIVPEFKWSKSGALLLRDDMGGPHYLIWGDDDLRLAFTYDLIQYRTFPTIYLKTRKDHFDSHLVESGPPPLRLSDGNYLFIYNSARKGFPSPRPDYDLQYNPGWIIIDGREPQRILQRCEEPLLSPVLKWEKGEEPYLGLVPNVVFVEGAKPLGNDKFLIFYGAADSVVGAAVITVEIPK